MARVARFGLSLGREKMGEGTNMLIALVGRVALAGADLDQQPPAQQPKALSKKFCGKR